VTVGIYSITHRESGKRYIGKSVNVENRLYGHKYSLTQPTFNKKACNRHLYNAVQKHGWEAFDTEILERFTEIDEDQIAARELFWMDHFNTCDRQHGYNLRRDSSTKMIVHEETRALHSITNTGEGNPNFGNYWSDEQRTRMSADRKAAHRDGTSYGDEWRAKISAATTEMWQDDEKKAAMARKVGLKKQRYDYVQYTKEGDFVRRWISVEEIVEHNPGYKWQNIYSVCHGYKPSYMGFVWRQVSRDEEALLLWIAAAA
jgi:group I intron endonuclease